MQDQPFRHRPPLSLGARLSLVALVLAGGWGSALAARAAAPAPATPPARKHPLRVGTLSNGMRILCRPDPSSEIISVVCLVRAGLPDESEQQAGLAALTAEALLKGTTTHPGSSFGDEIVAAGGNIRTVPGYDVTEVSVVASREQADAAIKLIGDVVAHPRFTPEDVNGAREALKRRIAAFQDDFTGASYQSLTAQLYQHTPYGRPLNGFAQTLDRLTAADVKRFWTTTYSQNRMVIAMVGDVDMSRAMATADKAFRDVPLRPGAVTPHPTLENIARPRVEVIQRPGPAAQLMVGYVVPGVTRDNYPVYAVLDAIVGGGKRARLFRNIREKHSLGYQLGSFYQPLQFQSHLVGFVVTPPFRRNPKTEQSEGLIEPVKEYLLQQYRELAETGPTEQELVRARAYAVGRYALREERGRDLARQLAWNVSMGLGADFDEVFAARAPLVTKEQVQAAAKGMVDHYALVVTVPEGEK